MKAYESHAHYSSKVRECSNFAIREIKKVCKEIGPRPAGYEGEKKGQDYVEKLMTPIADEVKREKFTLSPKAFMSWVMIDGILALVAAVLGILCFAFKLRRVRFYSVNIQGCYFSNRHRLQSCKRSAIAFNQLSIRLRFRITRTDS